MSPRPYTELEIRTMFLDHVRRRVDYWAKVEVGSENKDPDHYRLTGLAHSMLVLIDGGTDLPAFDLIPHPHESDEEYHKDEGTNWFPTGVVVNNCQLHDELFNDESGKAWNERHR